MWLSDFGVCIDETGCASVSAYWEYTPEYEAAKREYFAWVEVRYQHSPLLT